MRIMVFKNLLKKTSAAVFLGVMALSLPMTAVHAFTPVDEAKLCDKYCNGIEQNNKNVMEDLFYQMIISTEPGAAISVEQHLNVVDYGNLFDIINNGLVEHIDPDGPPIHWTPYAVVSASLERFPIELQKEILNDYHESIKDAHGKEKLKVLRSFVRISSYTRAHLINWLDKLGVS